MRALRSPLLLWSYVLLVAACGVWETQAEVRAVKLCGREFIRAVVYTCGGSRWRRLIAPQNLQGISNGEQSSAESLGEHVGSDLSTRDLNQICCRMGCLKSDLALLC